MTQILQCDKHDYLEIMCMFQYQVNVYLQDGEQAQGQATDVKTIDSSEYLVLLGKDGDRRSIPVLQIAKISVLTPNARFSEVQLQSLTK